MRNTFTTGRMTPILRPPYTSPDTPWTTTRQVQNMAKRLEKAPPSKKREKKISEKKCRKKEKVSTVEKKQNKFKSIFLENQVNLFNLILYPSIILSNYKTFFFLYKSHLSSSSSGLDVSDRAASKWQGHWTPPTKYKRSTLGIQYQSGLYLHTRPSRSLHHLTGLNVLDI